jgi:hypothetical protein
MASKILHRLTNRNVFWVSSRGMFSYTKSHRFVVAKAKKGINLKKRGKIP